MTIYTPNYMQGGSYTAKIDRWNGFAEGLDEGVLDLLSFAVTQRGAGANISVDVAAGDAIVTGDDQSLQGNYRVKSDAVVNVPLTAVPGTNSRYDIIILQVNDPDAGGAAGNNAVVTKVTGTASSSPVVPATPNSALLLATIGPISSGTSSVTNTIISSNRLLAGRKDFPGAMQLSANGTPNGWLMCNGQAVSRTTYAKLFTAIGTLYGPGNGSSTFNVPNLTDRVPVQAGASLTNIGATGGEAAHVLTIAEMPVHAHLGVTGNTSNDHNHTVDPPSTSVTGGPGGDPVRLVGPDVAPSGGVTNGAGRTNAPSGLSDYGVLTVNTAQFTSGGQSAGHTHSIPVDGGGTAANNMPPYQVMFGWIIRT